MIENFLSVVQVTKKDLERQRAKGLNNNPAKIAQLEYQKTQYELQLNRLKPYIDSIDVSKILFFIH